MMTGRLKLIARSILILGCLSLAASCSSRQDSSPMPMPAPAIATPTHPQYVPPSPHASTKHSKTARVSHQGDVGAGHKTASGEPYDPNALTAASRTLPIGSTAIVTNPATGKSVTVRINDRGPYVHGRSMDLSKHAAEKIGLTDKGVGRATIRPVESKKHSTDSAVQLESP